MTLRGLKGIVIGTVATLAATHAYSAVTVLGNGVARTCFEYAEFGGDPKNGIQSCDFAINQTPLPPKDLAATYINRGILKSRLDDADGAMGDYNRGLKLDPNLGEGYVDRGAVWIVMRRYDDALADIDKGISLNANRLQIAYYDRAIVEEAVGNIRGAYEDYRKATEIQPDFTLAQEQLARFKVVRHSDGT